MKNMERGSEGSEGSVYGNRLGKTEDTEEEQEQERKENQWGWLKRVELPTFERGDPIRWISRVENFFELQEVISKKKIRLDFTSMEGGASHWFRFWRKKTKNPTQEQLTEALTRRFREKDRCLVFEKQATVRQKGKIQEYIQEFEMLVAQEPNSLRSN